MSDRWPKELVVRPLSLDDARRIARWRYDEPWQVYNPRPEDGLLDPDQGYWAVAGIGGGRLVGFCCAGAEARVPGLAEEPGLLDVGVGMDPAWVGGGHGAAFGQAVVNHFRREHAIEGLRAVVQSWNQRSLRLTRRLGFVEVGRHVCAQDGRVVEYVVGCCCVAEAGRNYPLCCLDQIARTSSAKIAASGWR